MDEETIFRNEPALLYDYLPRRLPHRESQLKRLAELAGPWLSSRRGVNCFMHGPPGTGKTVCVRSLFENIENAKTIYINCWEYGTRVAIYQKMLNDIGVFVPRKGISEDEITARFREAYAKAGPIILCIDEIDRMKDAGILYDISRIFPLFTIMVSNDPYVFSGTDPRIKSSLRYEEIAMKRYTVLEMEDILEERIREAFRPGLVEAGVAKVAASASAGDVRAGLSILLKAGRKAERKLTIPDVKSAVSESRDASVSKKIGMLSEKELSVLKATDDGMTSGELQKRLDMNDRDVRRIISSLSDAGLITIKEHRGRGLTRKIYLNFSNELMQR